MCTFHPFVDSSIYGGNIQHSMLYFHNKNTGLLNNRFQIILPTNMLTYFVDINSFVSGIYIHDIADMVC